MTPKGLFLVFLGWTIVATAADDRLICPFRCFNNSTCAVGAADFSNHPVQADGKPLEIHQEVSRAGKHCACSEGFTGLRCARKYETCDDGNHVCYHDGKCIPGLKDIFGNDQLFCDCSDAIDEHGVHYVGKYCEIPVSTKCDSEGQSFCVNGGYCKPNSEETPHSPCMCSSDHDGPHCEFNKGQVPDCTLNCKNDGQCRLGMRSFMEGESYLSWANVSNYQYCDCAPGFYGLQCEIPSSRCGDHHCFHGGLCIQKSGPGGSAVKYHCDCNAAHTPSISYAGRYCQYESTTFCDKHSTENGQLFCVNGGTCNPIGSHLGCDCPLGFHGPICEFHDAENNGDYENCELRCDNGGQCRKGVKDNSFLDKFGPQLGHLNISHSRDFEHCVCPPGFVGLHCEHKMEVCGPGEHACFHGGECVSNDGDSHACNCQSGFTTLQKLAGPFCEHKSTAICTTDGQIGMGLNSNAFCVNHGTCRDFVDENTRHAGCDCPEQYEGPHCELLKKRVHEMEVDHGAPTEMPPADAGDLAPEGDASRDTDTTNTTPETSADRHSGVDPTVVTLSVLGAAAFVCAVGAAVCLIWCGRRSERVHDAKPEYEDRISPRFHGDFLVPSPRTLPQELSPSPLALPAPMDWEEHEMVNVEIL